jgi:hypothetical protein
LTANCAFADRLEVFFGDASDALCHVYARLRGPEAAQGLQLRGSLKGPSCLYAQTLPATHPLVDRGPGQSLLAEAIVPEPCFWTPEMPHLYRVDVRLERGADVLAREERFFGIRRLAAGGRKLIYDGKRWVLRGISRDKLPTTELASWHESDVAMLVRNPDNALCLEASRVGVLLVARLKPSELNEIHRLSRWPAVAMVVLPNRHTIDLGGLAHNLLLAQRFAPGEACALAPWAQVALFDVTPDTEIGSQIARFADCPLPLIAARIAGDTKRSTVAQARTLCDSLQRDLAGRVEPAGYIV